MIEIKTGIYGKEAVDRFVKMVKIERDTYERRSYTQLKFEAYSADDGELIINADYDDIDKFRAYIRKIAIKRDFKYSIFVGPEKGNSEKNNCFMCFTGERIFNESTRTKMYDTGMGYETSDADRCLCHLLAGYSNKKIVEKFGEELVNQVIGTQLDPVQAFNNKQFKIRKEETINSATMLHDEFNKFYRLFNKNIYSVINDSKNCDNNDELNNVIFRINEIAKSLKKLPR